MSKALDYRHPRRQQDDHSVAGPSTYHACRSRLDQVTRADLTMTTARSDEGTGAVVQLTEPFVSYDDLVIAESSNSQSRRG